MSTSCDAWAHPSGDAGAHPSRQWRANLHWKTLFNKNFVGRCEDSEICECSSTETIADTL